MSLSIIRDHLHEYVHRKFNTFKWDIEISFYPSITLNFQKKNTKAFHNQIFLVSIHGWHRIETAEIQHFSYNCIF